MTVVLKLGGSVITDKDAPETVDDDALGAAVDAVADADPERLVLVHGGGSFGHVAAADRGLSSEAGSHDAADVWAVHDAMRRLNDAVIRRLHDAGVAALPVHPLSVAARGEERALSLPIDSTATLLAEGFVPVLHGDVVGHAGAGATIVSGDELVTRLATRLDADRVGLCSTVSGVYDGDGSVIPGFPIWRRSPTRSETPTRLTSPAGWRRKCGRCSTSTPLPTSSVPSHCRRFWPATPRGH